MITYLFSSQPCTVNTIQAFHYSHINVLIKPVIILSENFASLLCHVQNDSQWLTMGSRLDDACSRNTVTSLVSWQQNLASSSVETCGSCDNLVMSSLSMTLIHHALQHIIQLIKSTKNLQYAKCKYSMIKHCKCDL